jgi:predicted DNA-binding transcriptional regulator YafY
LATNKLAIIRYQTLDKCFSNTGRRYYIENLIEECNDAIYEFSGNEIGIKKRQLFEDIKFMESPQGWSIPLERIRDGHRVYYQYEDKNFSINNQPLNETESNQLKEALVTLSRFKGLPQFEWVSEITARIDSGLSLSTNDQNIIEFEQNNYLKGLDHITPIYNGILFKQTLQISYESFKRNGIQSFLIHPYFLKQYNNRWFVFGLNDLSDRLINLALDRIFKINQSSTNYKPNESVDFSEMFEDIVGVSIDNSAEIQKIILEVSNDIMPYIDTKPLHGSQKTKEKNEKHSIITLDLIPNYELEALIFSYGDNIQVIEPKELKEKIAERVSNLFEKYKTIKNAASLHSNN